MQFQVPSVFADAIASDNAVSSDINAALSSLFPWFLDNKLFFFPEFTDHGVDHINTVLASAADLITEEARSILTAHDAAATVAGILLHDCAMHISWDGFCTLISGEYRATSPLLDSNAGTWPELFSSFMHEARRWDQVKLIEVVGSVQPVRDPPRLASEVTETDRRVIGEFVRRQHARLAHEIAILGVPGPLERRIDWIRPFSNVVLPADLIGFIARSHNLNIREAKDQLPELRRREYSGIHVPYVMALLRIADYCQIQSRRAHPSLLSIRRLTSPISIAEWKKHAATVDIHRQDDDPEALVVHTEPSDVTTVFGLRDLFRSMQQELDETWATLGEVYGRFPKLEALAFRGLSIRRIKTNLDNLGKYESEQKPPFLPVELRLKSAGADMLALLVGPLYDGDPSVAIRELVQNAVDSCSERAAYETSIHSEENIEGLVDVRLEFNSEKKGFLEVKDNGIGMTLETVRDYFLVAGASFRKSLWWKQHFLAEDGKSSVRRSGRFGIGALASFLVGPNTIVTTRHVDEKSGFGIQFRYSVDNNYVQARRVSADVGTTIRVEITDPKVFDAFDYDDQYSDEKRRLHWYGLDLPQVTCIKTVEGKPEKIERTFSIPSPEQPLPNGWYSVDHKNFRAIHWSFNDFNTGVFSISDAWLLCNGILVCDDWDEMIDLSISPRSRGLQLDVPTVSVFDPDGYLPLNLSRDGLADAALPFRDELVLSMATWLVEKIKASNDEQPTMADVAASISALDPLIHHPSYHRSLFGQPAIYTSKGLCFSDSTLLSATGIQRILFVLKDEVLKYSEFLNGYLSLRRFGRSGNWTNSSKPNGG